MTFTFSFLDIVYAALVLLIIAAIVVLIRLAQVLKDLRPSLKSLAQITSDAEAITSDAKQKLEGVDQIFTDAKLGFANLATAIKGDQSLIKSAGTFVNAISNLIGIMKKSGNKKNDK